MLLQHKHAYLIIAHHNFNQLKLLINLLDDKRNDIYLHVDKKSEEFHPEEFKTTYSDLIILDRMNVTWAGQSLIQCILKLLESASKNHYEYYHLISGDDLPLKSQDEIHAFFAKNQGKNFIEFDEKANLESSFRLRMQYYYFFQDYIGKIKEDEKHTLFKAERYSLKLQQRLNIQRKEYIPAYKGTNWFSITDDLVQYVLKQKSIIRKQFYHSYAADELFLQSLVMDSPYRNTIENNSLRAIDWKRGKPYIYRLEDVPELLLSGALFARKFDIKVDKAAINAVVSNIRQANKEE